MQTAAGETKTRSKETSDGMRQLLTALGCSVVCLLAACGTPQVLTHAIYEDRQRAVGLQTIPDGDDGTRFSHPTSLKKEDVANVMKGLYVETRDVPIALPLLGGGQPERRPLFSKGEIEFFAPLFAKAFHLAGPNQIVTFYETAEISDVHELTTSGGLFVQGNELHVVLSNYGVKTEIWQDSEEYRAPVKHRPLEQIDPQPGRLVFDPPRFMVEPRSGTLATFTHGKPWRVGVRFGELR